MENFSREYFDILKNGTLKKEMFFDKKIEQLYNEISNYVKKYHIIEAMKFDDRFNVMIDGNLYEIGEIFNHEIVYYIRMIKDDNNLFYLDIDDVIHGRLADSRQIKIYRDIRKMRELISELNSLNIPFDLIEKETNNQIKSLKYSKK